MKVNGTVAKNVAIYFLEKTTDRFTPSMVARTIGQAKNILKAGYTEEEIKSVIDYIIENTSVKMYSIGYISTSINSILDKISEQEKLKAIQEVKKSIKEMSTAIEMEVELDSDSAERNKRKVDKFGYKSRLREKFDSDLFE